MIKMSHKQVAIFPTTHSHILSSSHFYATTSSHFYVTTRNVDKLRRETVDFEIVSYFMVIHKTLQCVCFYCNVFAFITTRNMDGYTFAHKKVLKLFLIV